MSIMRKLALFLWSLFLSFSLIAQTCPQVTSTSGTVTCTTPCTTITSTVTPIYATNTYSVSSITYSPFSYTTGTSVSTSSDDIYTTGISLPFCFSFFGTTYNTVYIGSNGNISFNSAISGAYDPWSISGPLPGSNCNATYNAIMGSWCDMYPPAGGTIKYATYGSAPCRAFVVSYYNIPLFGSCGGTKDTTQIVIYETTNIIDIYLGSHNIPLCTTWNSGRAVTGIENASGSLYYTVTGQNGVAFSASKQGWRFSPSGTPATWSYSWTGPGGVIGTSPSVSVCPTVTTTYTITASVTTCAGVVPFTSTSVVTPSFNLAPILGPSMVCQGQSIVLTDSVSGGSWSSSNTGIAIVNSTGIVFGVSPGTCTITYSLGGFCTMTKSVTVNPIYNSSIYVDICQGDSYLFGGTPYSNTGVYTYTFSSINGCDSTVTLNLTVWPLPTASFYTNPYMCVGDTSIIALTAHSSDAIDYWWDFGGATIVTSSATHGGPYSVKYTTPGIYVIKMVVQSAHCYSDTLRDTIRVINYPDAQIAPLIFPNGSIPPCFGDSVLFRPLNWDYNNYYLWQPMRAFPSRINRNEYGIIEFPTWVSLTVTNAFGCRTTDSVFVDAVSCCSLRMPNAFTPNGDGQNDIFRPFAGHYHLHEFFIVNRWGQQVFSTVTPGSGWNGTFNGVPQDIGTFFYYIEYDCDGVVYHQEGDLTLIR